jgi:hypothetical protein
MRLFPKSIECRPDRRNVGSAPGECCPTTNRRDCRRKTLLQECDAVGERAEQDLIARFHLRRRLVVPEGAFAVAALGVHDEVRIGRVDVFEYVQQCLGGVIITRRADAGSGKSSLSTARLKRVVHAA